MERELYLIRLGEIYLKGTNRAFFEKRLRGNLKQKLKGLNARFKSQKGRLFLEADSSTEIEAALRTTMGIVGFSPAVKTKKSYEKIEEGAVKLFGELLGPEVKSFKIESRRADKSFPLTSYQISSALGAAVLKAYPEVTVNVHKPDVVLYVEVRDRAYIYPSTSHLSGPGGLPVGAAGKGVLMLSGGIDSPVAGYLMAARGLRQDAVYFHTYPYTSDEALGKVKQLAQIISPYLSGLKLHVVPFTDAQLHINSSSPEEQHTLMMRYAMVKIANMVAGSVRASCLVTGESLSQVASQTIESIAFTESASDIPILRPLIGLNKEQIIRTAQEIGTYETSILPYEDCCTIFSPAHPLVRPDKQEVTASYNEMKIESLLVEAFESREIFQF